MTASAQSFSYNATPEPGTVPELATVEIIFPEWDEIEINSKDDITATLDGTAIEGVNAKVTYGTNAMTFMFHDRMVTPGEYVINIPAYSICGYTYDDAGEMSGYADLENDIALTYTIDGAAPGSPTFAFTASPAAGKVEELTTATITFPEFTEIEILSAGDLGATFNGTPIENMKIANSSYGSNDIAFTFPKTMTEPGEYVLTIPAGTISGYDAAYIPTDLTEDITVTYTIEAKVGELDFSYVADPSTENMIRVLSEIELLFTNLTSVEADKSKVAVSVNGEALSSEAFDVYGSDVPELGNAVYVKLAEEITEGEVAFTFPAGSLSGKTADGDGVNSSDIELRYTVASAVAYDLSAALSAPTKPNADGEISAEKQLTSFFFSVDKVGIEPIATETANVTIKEVNGDFEKSAVLKKAFGFDSSLSYMSAEFGSQPVYNGEYVVTIAKGSFGDTIWRENPEYGHSNDVIELHFTLIDGQDKNVYDIEPLDVKPSKGNVAAPDLRDITVRFADGIAPKDEAYATLAGVDVSYLENAVFAANEDGSYTAAFETIPTELGNYVLSIVAGQFGDADFIAGNGGHGNAEIEVEYKVDSLTGIGSIETAPAADGVYNIHGFRVADSAEGLPAGIYISGGKKIVVR